MAMKERIDHWFTYHPPRDPDTVDSYRQLRDAARVFAHEVDRLVPDSADKTAAIRKIREAVMTANAAIACEGK